MKTLFHLSFNVTDLAIARAFYVDVLGCTEGRMSERLTQSGLDFVIPPHHRFPGQAGEQWTMFFRDPCGNPIEVKGFKDLASVFSA